MPCPTYQVYTRFGLCDIPENAEGSPFFAFRQA